MLTEDAKWYEVSLRISGDKVDPEELTSLLELEPTRTGRKGEPITKHPRSAKYKENVWIWRATTDTARPFEAQLPEALSILEPRAAQLRQLVARSDVEVYWFLGFASGNGQGMATFQPQTLSRLAILGLDVVLDLYPDFLNADGEWE